MEYFRAGFVTLPSESVLKTAGCVSYTEWGGWGKGRQSRAGLSLESLLTTAGGPRTKGVRSGHQNTWWSSLEALVAVRGLTPLRKHRWVKWTGKMAAVVRNLILNGLLLGAMGALRYGSLTYCIMLWRHLARWKQIQSVSRGPVFEEKNVPNKRKARFTSRAYKISQAWLATNRYFIHKIYSWKFCNLFTLSCSKMNVIGTTYRH